MPACPVYQIRPLRIEGSRVELGIFARGRQRPDLDLSRCRIQPHDGIARGVGESWCAVRPDDYPLRARILAKRNPFNLPATRNAMGNARHSL
jgi:hypothetical protein